MRLKLIDKYILQTLLGALFFITASFLMLFIVQDLFGTLGDFVDNKTPAIDAVKYYLVKIPAIMIFIMPIATLLAVLHGLYNLTKHNELTAMRASGISLIRLIIPIIAIGVVMSSATLLINETLGPRATYWVHIFDNAMTQQKKERRKKDEQGEDYEAPEKLDSRKGYGIAYRNQTARRTWFIEEFDSRTFNMKNATITQERENGFNDKRITAASIQWLDETWWALDVIIQKFSKEGHPIGFPEMQKRLELADLNERPLDFLKMIKGPEHMSASELGHYLDENKQISNKDRNRLRTDYHFRMAFPWACLVTTLLGVPFGYATARKGILTGIIICFSICFSYFILINILMALSKFGKISPLLAFYIPNIIYAGLGAWLIKRMR